MTVGSTRDREISNMTLQILMEIESRSSKELTQSDEMIRILHLTNMHHAKTLLEHENEAPSTPERDIAKQAVVRALLISSWHQRLYFIIRSMIMGLIGSFLTITYVLILGPITLVHSIPFGIFSLVLTLVISRLFDVQIVKIARTIIDQLSNHQRIRNFILSHF